MIRFDSNKLYNALDKKHLERGITWKQLSNEIGVSESTIKRTKLGGRMEVDGMLAMVCWLGVPAETFTKNTLR